MSIDKDLRGKLTEGDIPVYMDEKWDKINMDFIFQRIIRLEQKVKEQQGKIDELLNK